MDLGKVDQLKVYESAIEHCSNIGNRSGVELFSGLICKIALKEKGRACSDFKKAETKKTFFSKRKRKRKMEALDNYREYVESYDEWLKEYSLYSSRMEEYLSRADSNFWKQV